MFALRATDTAAARRIDCRWLAGANSFGRYLAAAELQLGAIQLGGGRAVSCTHSFLLSYTSVYTVCAASPGQNNAFLINPISKPMDPTWEYTPPSSSFPATGFPKPRNALAEPARTQARMAPLSPVHRFRTQAFEADQYGHGEPNTAGSDPRLRLPSAIARATYQRVLAVREERGQTHKLVVTTPETKAV
ncbi:hypothetical protein CkaCkLH20_06251 [Colletotrichum karsti]|uniref:Uncharacterized protein n=1 Tax=Colletotrichum karsti TaxID=1095194 RepID=A0A9P6I2W0_9PEZI|nr:uncharacterized protein CkaCkLH20_06251 [Colletotrichum karsti]KAF9876308.1 hypothetical protein CkaCkLH20_06251 [Colletotrichum karsti]